MESWLDKYLGFKSIHKVKAFFLQIRWKETFIFLLFVLLAFGFWLLQNMQREYEIEVIIPVKYENMPTEMVSINNYPRELRVKVRDRGAVLVTYSLFRSFNPLEVDLEDIRTTGELEVSRRTVESSVSRQLLASSSLISIDPREFTVVYEKIQYKDVPVKLDLTLGLEPGYQIVDSMTVVPNLVRVYANSDKLDSITDISTEAVEIKKVNQTQTVQLKLQDISGIYMEPDKVSVTVPIEQFTEKRIRLDVHCTDVPSKYTLRTFPSSVELVCNVPISRFREVKDSDFEINIPFQQFENRQSNGKFTLYMTKQPPWISQPVIIPDVIEFIIEQNSL
ncbi:MAG: YbbR-like domain-containing protein [Tannerella sp.]|jgi:YbbR domain-containing protein|nr:YbbR-like domain-containing protein [Tannerella sp.]